MAVKKWDGTQWIVQASNSGSTPAAGTLTSGANGPGYLGMPQVLNGKTLDATDAGKHIYITSATQTVTIPASSSTIMPVGFTVVIINQSGGNATLAVGSGETLYWAGNGSTTAPRTIGNYGMATLVKVATATWFISGTGLV